MRKNRLRRALRDEPGKMGEKGGNLNKKGTGFSINGRGVRLAICPAELYNYNVVSCDAHKRNRPDHLTERGVEHGTKPQ